MVHRHRDRNKPGGSTDSITKESQMGINWRDIFRGIGAGATYVAGEMREQRLDEREEQQIKERARLMDDLEKEREKSRQEFQKKLAEDTAKMQSSLRMKEQETGYIYDKFGLQLGRDYTKTFDMSPGDPRRQEVMDKIGFATNMLAEAKGGRTDFTSDELDMLPAEFRVGFTGTVLENRRFDEQVKQNEANINSQMQLRLAQGEQARGYAEYLKNSRGKVDQLESQKERQRQLKLIDGIKSEDWYGFVENALMQGQRPEDLAQSNPVQWNAFLRGQIQIKEANAIAIQQGLLAGMTPEELGLVRPEREEVELPPEEKKKTGIKSTWAIEKGLKQAGERIKEKVPGVKALEKAIAPVAAREKAVDRALTIGLQKAKKRYGASVMSYEQAMDLKENRPGAANKQRFVAIDPATRKVAVFEFYIKNGKLAARKVG